MKLVKERFPDFSLLSLYFELAIVSYLFDTIPLVGKICDVVVVMTVFVLIISSMSIFRKAKISRN